MTMTSATILDAEIQRTLDELEAIFPTGLHNEQPPKRSASDICAAAKDAMAAAQRQIAMLRQKAQPLLRKALHKSLLACIRVITRCSAPRRQRAARPQAKHPGSTGKSSDSDGPAPHPRRLSLSLRAFLAQVASVLEVRQ